MSKYVIGIDYGTLSGRASLVDTADGRVLSSSVYDYPHAVMDTALPCGLPLAPDWALQHPQIIWMCSITPSPPSCMIRA